jgi:Zn finger protein HypA/HybF involved in hydrogenase expression
LNGTVSMVRVAGSLPWVERGSGERARGLGDCIISRPGPVGNRWNAADVCAVRVSSRGWQLDLYLGSEFNVSFTRQEVCSHCRGHGAAHKKDILACPFCHGTGMRCSIAHQHGEPLGRFWQQLNTTCTKCDGTGHHINSTCPVCGGHKVLLKSITKTVHVPPGAPDSYRITLANEGDQVPDLLPVCTPRPLMRRWLFPISPSRMYVEPESVADKDCGRFLVAGGGRACCASRRVYGKRQQRPGACAASLVR